MSKEALTAFLKKVAEDADLQKKLVDFAAAQGFEFSEDELTESDLNGVAGGLLSVASTGTVGQNVADLQDLNLRNLQDVGLRNMSEGMLDPNALDLRNMA